MIATVIDTTVLIVANGETEQASLSCFSCCIDALEEARKQIVVVDDAFLIFNEYKHEVNPIGQPGVGDAFLLWLLRNWLNPDCCELVSLTSNEQNSFAEFPNDPDLVNFDPSDHKFVAVASASIHGPTVLNAVDSDWWIHGVILKRNGVKIAHVCADQVVRWEDTKTQK